MDFASSFTYIPKAESAEDDLEEVEVQVEDGFGMFLCSEALSVARRAIDWMMDAHDVVE